MGRFKRFEMWLGWGPMVLSREYEVRAVEDDMKSVVPPDAPSETLTFKRMDYYRNRILAMNVYLTFLMVFFGFYFYTKMWQDGISNARNPLLVGAIFGFGYGVYDALNYRKRLFKEGRLTIGYKKLRRYRYRITYYLLLLISVMGIWYILWYLFGPGSFLAIIGFALPALLIQWLWYYDIKRWERKHDQVFIWKPQGWYQEVIIEPQEAG